MTAPLKPDDNSAKKRKSVSGLAPSGRGDNPKQRPHASSVVLPPVKKVTKQSTSKVAETKQRSHAGSVILPPVTKVVKQPRRKKKDKEAAKERAKQDDAATKMGDLFGEFKPIEMSAVAPVVVTNQRWSELGSQASRASHAVWRFRYKRRVGANVQNETTDIVTASGNTLSKLHSDGGEKYGIESLNVTTRASEVGTASGKIATRKHVDLFAAAGKSPEAMTNIMRVIKGTQSDEKPLVGGVEHAKAAVEFAAEITISEGLRGGKAAVGTAMEAFYLMKHKQMTEGEFLDPYVGFPGAGEGGAARLRDYAEKMKVDAFSLHEAQMRKRFAKVQQDKDKKGKWEDEQFEDWYAYKMRKWTQKY